MCQFLTAMARNTNPPQDNLPVLSVTKYGLPVSPADLKLSPKLLGERHIFLWEKEKKNQTKTQTPQTPNFNPSPYRYFSK